jgi:hypothetical protein
MQAIRFSGVGFAAVLTVLVTAGCSSSSAGGDATGTTEQEVSTGCSGYGNMGVYNAANKYMTGEGFSSNPSACQSETTLWSCAACFQYHPVLDNIVPGGCAVPGAAYVLVNWTATYGGQSTSRNQRYGCAK